jgi:hypothetical protein
MKIFAQRSVGILPAHTLRPVTPERRIAITPLARSLPLARCEADCARAAFSPAKSAAPRAQAECRRYPALAICGLL